MSLYERFIFRGPINKCYVLPRPSNQDKQSQNAIKDGRPSRKQICSQIFTYIFNNYVAFEDFSSCLLGETMDTY